jgi:hypothetical protein
MTTQPRGPVDWARHYAAEREKRRAAGRPTAATITDQELDRLHANLDRYAAVQGELNKRVIELTRRATRAEAAVARVRHLADRIRRGAPWAATRDSLATRIVATLDQPAPAHNAGPSVAECAANDRHWPLQKHGE